MTLLKIYFWVIPSLAFLSKYITLELRRKVFGRAAERPKGTGQGERESSVFLTMYGDLFGLAFFHPLPGADVVSDDGGKLYHFVVGFRVRALVLQQLVQQSRPPLCLNQAAVLLCRKKYRKRRQQVYLLRLESTYLNLSNFQNLYQLLSYQNN